MYKITKHFAPESSFCIDDTMSQQKICRAHATGEFLTCKVVRWNSQKEFLEVSLGNGFHGVIPKEEISIYPLKHSPYFSVGATIYTLVGRTICVCVKKISDHAIILSRKENMIKAFEYIKNNTKKIFTCQITSIENYGLFVEVGCGITGLLPQEALTVSKLTNPKDVKFMVKDFISAKITGVDETKYHISLSHKDLCTDLSDVLNENDIIVAVCLAPVNESGYFGYVNPATTAIIDVPPGFKILYGKKVVCRVKQPAKSQNKLKLDFISFVFE